MKSLTVRAPLYVSKLISDMARPVSHKLIQVPALLQHEEQIVLSYWDELLRYIREHYLLCKVCGKINLQFYGGLGKGNEYYSV